MNYRCVLLESPYRANTQEEIEQNVSFAQDCLRDSLLRGESPMASHLLYTQALDDNVDQERKIGIEAGIRWQSVVDYVVVYVNRGISSGMRQSIEAARARHMPVVYRNLNKKNEARLKLLKGILGTEYAKNPKGRDEQKVLDELEKQNNALEKWEKYELDW